MRARKRRKTCRLITPNRVMGSHHLSGPSSLFDLNEKLLTCQQPIRDDNNDESTSYTLVETHATTISEKSFTCRKEQNKTCKDSDTKFFTRRKGIYLPATNVTSYLSLLCTYLLLTLLLTTSLVDCQRLATKLGQLPFSTLDTLHHHYQRTSSGKLSNGASNNLVPEIIVQQGGVIKGNKNVTLTKQYNPILITQNIVVKKDARLTIEAGVELLFEKQKGIVVYGSLDILGEPNDRVKLALLKSQQSATINFRSQNNSPIGKQQIRLVDGDLPSEGRVQIKFNDRWHSLCTSSKNLTAADIRVICRQVGYQDGHWYRWFPRRNDTTALQRMPQLMSKSFLCAGNELSISQCKRWPRVRAGGGVCDHHSDLGVKCSERVTFTSAAAAAAAAAASSASPDSDAQPYEYWGGIEFLNSETRQEYLLDGQMKRKVSTSTLRSITVTESGLSELGNATAAIRVVGQPPRMLDVEVRNSIYGITIEDVDDAVHLDNVRLYNNLGSPLFINTSWGKVQLDNLHVENNLGDGVRVVRHEKVQVGAHDFCKFANLGSSQSYPVTLSHEQTFFTSGRECCQEFISANNQLTVHFPLLRSTPNNLLPNSESSSSDSSGRRLVSIPPGVSIGKDAHLLIYDDYSDEFSFKLRIQNGTRAQSVVSKSGRLKICYEPAHYRTVLFTIEVVADQVDGSTSGGADWSGIARDVEISNSSIVSNQGRGIWIENQRSGVKIYNTTVLNHDYLAGVHVENGTGEVIIQASTISNNTGHGVYINLAGGYYHVDKSTISDNTLKGLLIEYDLRRELVSFNHTIHVGYSTIGRNGEQGVFLGNVCRSDAFWNISMNSFVRNGEDAIFFQSCLPTPETIYSFRNLSLRLNMSDPDLAFHNNYQELLIEHNVFSANLRKAISMAPIFFVKSFIRHNLFKDHQLAVLHVSNRAAPPYESMENANQAPVSIRVASNRFYSNRGRYVVNLGVQEDNPRHSLTFTKNTLEDNTISEPYADLKPRSRVSAVVVVSSSNTKVIRNRFNNPHSAFEMGSHLELHWKTINATANFWGHGLDSGAIYRRIFDRKNRYNLAQVEFLQYLLRPEDLEYATDLSFDRERDKIAIFRNGTRLGGEVKGYEELQAGAYIVHDDIFVRGGSHLVLRPGTVLKFHDGVGMMVQGRLDALGQLNSQIIFTSSISTNRLPPRVPVTTTPAPFANPWVSHQPEGGTDDELAASVESRRQQRMTRDITTGGGQQQSVRLSHVTMGRLEANIDGVWGPVCDYNFDINDAAVVCQQLGMILNKDDWLLEKFQYATNDQQQISMMSTNVLMTNLQCDPALDTDLTRCKAEISLRGDFDGLCNSEVGIRCFPPSWSGVRMGMGAEISSLEHVTIQRAGMFDYAAYSLRPALQIDLNKHFISFITVKSNSDSGLGIMWNDIIGRHFHELSLSDSKFINNERHGIELRSKGLSIKSCLISNNRQNGLDYNPSFAQEELDDLLSWLYTTKNLQQQSDLSNILTLTFPLQTKYFFIPSSDSSHKFFILQKRPQPQLDNLIESFTIATDPGHMLSIHLLSPIHPESTESLNMSLGLSPESPVWDLRTNMTSFPMISPGYKFYFNYSSGEKPRGNVVLYVRSRYNNRDLKQLSKYVPAHLVMNKFEQTATNINSKLLNSLVINNSNITKNGVGLRFRHPNYAHDSRANYNLRYSNETTNITNNLFDANHFSCIFVGSDDYLESLPANSQNLLLNTNKTVPASEINYHVLGNRLRRNKDGIRQLSRDVLNSNNVFHWSISDTNFESNKGGGINIVLPYYWHYDANLSHSVEIHNNSFWRNSNFEMTINGHYAVLNVSRNSFKENKCKRGLISIEGMEKKMSIVHNTLEYNTCNRIVDFNIQSHADKMGHVTGQFEFNSLRHNRKLALAGTYNISREIASTFKSSSKLLGRLHPQSSDYTMCLEGLQSLNITRNLFVNPDLRFELVVAILMDPNERTVNAVENYWGSTMYSHIEDRIFDFDDWNNYALAELSPYLTQESFSGASIIGDTRLYQATGLSRTLGGRLTKSLNLVYRKEPYVVESDLTVMPNVRLTIEKGVTLEFMPNVGILVLGDLLAMGSRDRPIQMRPYLSAADVLPLHQYLFPPRTKPQLVQATINDPMSWEHNYALKHYKFAYPIDMGSVRLCKNEICNDGSHIYENNVEDATLRQEVLKSNENSWKLDGFLEIYNMTTLRWVPVCDPLFTEHAAQVVCRQLGYSHLSLFKRGRRYTIEQEQISSIGSWPESLLCEGHEFGLSSCPLAAVQSATGNHSTACTKNSNQFVYVHCRDFPEISGLSNASTSHLSVPTDELVNYWGGIRFSCPTGGDSSSQDARYAATPAPRSKLQYLNIDRAGMLHRRRSPALQVLQCNVQVEYVSITNSAHHGLEIITSQGNQNFHKLNIRNCLGVGMNYLSLTGSSSPSRLVPYLPLKHLDISSDIFGLIDICGANKELQIEERLLLFYRYSSRSVDCVKIISSKLSIKHIGIRMLQFDLFNSSSFASRPDAIHIYDGNIFDIDSRLLVELGVKERHRLDKPELKFCQTTDNTMTVKLHASGASSQYGFIAEVVTTPVSLNIQRDSHNNLTFSEITNNKLGALTIASAGESSPNLIIRNNRFESNCMHLFANFTSCTNPVYMELQNCQKLRIVDNFVKNNQGGITVKSYSHTAVSALEALIENNVFEGNMNLNVLALLGPKTDPYQSVKVAKNYFTRNTAQYLSNIVLSRIVANFSYNIVSGNIGKHQIEVIGFDKLPLSYQTFSYNWLYNNTATFERDRSTIFGNSAGQKYYMNYLVNPDNHFEISTMNWSRYDVRSFHAPKDDEIIHLAAGDGSSKDVFRKTADAIPISIIDTKKNELYHATINAKHNWWGFNATSAIQGRIRDRVQHDELLKVDFAPYLETNSTVLSGICAGGWQRVGEACLVYVGSRMTYHEARDFCDKEQATLPLLRGNHYEFTDFINAHDDQFDARVDRVWVRSFEVSRDACPAINDYRTKNYDCQDKYAFLCEKDPQIVVSLLQWHRETGGLVALILALITVLLTTCCTICWAYKSRQRHKEKIERKNSVYASMRSNRASSYSSELYLHRQLYNPEKSSLQSDMSLSTRLTPQLSDLVHLDPTFNNGASGSVYHQNQNNVNRMRTGGGGGGSSNKNTESHANLTDASPGQDRFHQASVEYKNIPLAARPKAAPPLPPMVYERQPSMNPDYVSPAPSKGRRSIASSPGSVISKPPTPAPAYREAHPRALSQNGSQASSVASGSHNGFGDDYTFMTQSSPIPVPPPPLPPPTSITYSQINHLTTSAVPTNGQQSSFRLPPTYFTANLPQVSFRPQRPASGQSDTSYLANKISYQPAYEPVPAAAPSHQLQGRSQTHLQDIDESVSSVPTYYSNNQLYNYEESTESYVEAYTANDEYNRTIQKMTNNDQTSQVLTDRSSFSDLLINSQTSSQHLVYQLDNRSNLSGLTKTTPTAGYHGGSSSVVAGLEQQQGHNNRAYSETASSINRYLVETSFDFDSPVAEIDVASTPAPAAPHSMFGSSQRLSPVSSTYVPTDSKQGSRVYLETSFE